MSSRRGGIGGDGVGQGFIDLERVWTLDHVELVDRDGTSVGGTLRDSCSALPASSE